MHKMKVVIVDDNSIRREQLRKAMPEYADVVASSFGESAIKAILPDSEGVIPDLVILNGEDNGNHGLDTFKWIKEKSGSARISAIPVIVLVDDEFSDRSLEFLDIDDVTFYEGEVDEDRIFSLMMETINEYEFAPEIEEPVYTEDKSYDRVVGLSLRPLGEEDGPKRSIVVGTDERMANLEAALERGRRKVETIRAIIAGDDNVSDDIGDEEGLIGGGIEHRSLDSFEKDDNEDDIPEEFRIHNREEKKPIIQSQINRRPVEEPKMPPKTIVIVDDEENDRRVYEMYLYPKYNVVTLDSGMKAIDYFVKNKADLLLIDTYMPNLGGVQTLASVRWQPNGREVPVIYIIDKRYPVAKESLIGTGVIGILQKPMSPGGMIAVIDGYFRNKR